MFQQERPGDQQHSQEQQAAPEHVSPLAAFSFLDDGKRFQGKYEINVSKTDGEPASEVTDQHNPNLSSTIETKKHILMVDGFKVTVYERRPDTISIDRPVVYLPGFLEGVNSNIGFLDQLDDRVVYALDVSAGTNRFKALQAVTRQFASDAPTPDVVTHSMGAFVLDHDYTINPDDADAFHRAVLITPPGFIQDDSFTRLLTGFMKEAWQGTFSSRPEFRRSDKEKPILEGCRYIFSGVKKTYDEARHVSSVDLAESVAYLLSCGKDIFSIVTTNDCLIPGDKTEEGLRRGGLTDSQIATIEGTHIPHINTPAETATIVKDWLLSEDPSIPDEKRDDSSHENE